MNELDKNLLELAPKFNERDWAWLESAFPELSRHEILLLPRRSVKETFLKYYGTITYYPDYQRIAELFGNKTELIERFWSTDNGQELNAVGSQLDRHRYQMVGSLP